MCFSSRNLVLLLVNEQESLVRDGRGEVDRIYINTYRWIRETLVLRLRRECFEVEFGDKVKGRLLGR